MSFCLFFSYTQKRHHKNNLQSYSHYLYAICPLFHRYFDALNALKYRRNTVEIALKYRRNKGATFLEQWGHCINVGALISPLRYRKHSLDASFTHFDFGEYYKLVSMKLKWKLKGQLKRTKHIATMLYTYLLSILAPSFTPFLKVYWINRTNLNWIVWS